MDATGAVVVAAGSNEHYTISAMDPNDPAKVLEAKVYRKWTSNLSTDWQPSDYTCMLLDRQGDAILANMNLADTQYFDNALQLNSTYRITHFICEAQKTFYQPINRKQSLRFGRFTTFDVISGDDFPDHHFNFISFSQLEDRLALKNSVLTDYIGAIQSVGELKITGNPNEKQIVRRVLQIVNLNGNVVSFTLWDKMAREFDKDSLEKMERPVIIAVSSCGLSKYTYTGVQLSATAATHYYLNPTIPEAEESMNRYREMYNQIPQPIIERKKQTDKKKEQIRNRVPLAKLQQLNPAAYKFVRFTCDGMIVDLDINKPWFYITCYSCNNKVSRDGPLWRCLDHGPQPNPTYKYNFKGWITDYSTNAPITFFSPIADTLAGIKCADLVEKRGYTDPKQLPPELLALKGKKEIFQFHFNPKCRQGNADFMLDDLLYDTLQQDQNITPLLIEPLQKDTTADTTEEKETETGTKTPATSNREQEARKVKKEYERQQSTKRALFTSKQVTDEPTMKKSKGT